MQAQGHAQVMVRFADYHQNPQAASDAPRWRIDQGLTVNIEEGVAPEVIDELRRRGHIVEVGPLWSEGRLTAASREGVRRRAAANPRGMQGYAAGR